MKNLFLLLIVFSLISCSKQSELSKKYDCKIVKNENTTEIIDFKKNFKLMVPSNWKVKLYFTKNESEIFTADTIKQLTNSFILGASYKLGSLHFNEEFYRKTDSVLTKNNLQLIDSGKQVFQSKPSFWYVAKGSKNGFTYHQFNLTSKQSENTYFNGYSEIYGDDNIKERICETISILEKIEFLQ